MVSWADPRSVPRWFPRTGDTSSGGGGQEARERGPGRRSGGTPSSRWAWVRPTSAPSPCLTPVPLWQFYADLIFSFSYKDQNVKTTEHTRESVNSRELWLLGTWVSARLRRHRRTSVPDQEYSSSRHRQSLLLASSLAAPGSHYSTSCLPTQPSHVNGIIQHDGPS